MALVNDIQHMTFVTADLDRLMAFDERIFDARVAFDREEEGGLRRAFIEIGPHTMLHPFQMSGVDVPGREPMFERGRLDHFGLDAASEEAFRSSAASSPREPEPPRGSLVTDMGSMSSFSFYDRRGAGGRSPTCRSRSSFDPPTGR